MVNTRGRKSTKRDGKEFGLEDKLDNTASAEEAGGKAKAK